MRRHAIGLMALLLFAGAAVMWAWPSVGRDYPALEAACWRGGALAAVVWLTYADIKRLPRWLLLAAPVVLLVVAFRPRWALFLVPVLLAIGLLRPRK